MSRAFLLAAVLLYACQPATGGSDAGADAGPGPLAPAPEAFDCRNPTLAERQSPVPYGCLVDRTCRTRLVSAHRGAGGDLGELAPENTVAAVRAAVLLGVDFIETDPRPTSDGIIVNVHDTDVERVTTGTGTVSMMTLAEVKALPLDAAKYKGEFGCERIATLREILEAAKGRAMVLVDANKTDRVDLLVADIQATGTQEWAIFDTSSPTKIEEALRLEPNLLTMIRTGSVADLDAQLARFAAHPPIIVEVDRTDSAAEVAAAVHARGHRPFTDVFVEDIVVALDGKLKQYDKSWALGIDIAQTDRPAEMLRYLGRR
jgi:glycerophosphoryl diester phosphodiesterase